MFDDLSISFSNPALDPMAYDQVEGMLVCGRDAIELHFKQRDRAFKKNETQIVSFDYSEVEKIEWVNRWLRPKVLVLQVRTSEKLGRFPGAGVGRVELHVPPASRKDASKVEALVRFHQSEARLRTSESRWDKAREDA